MKQKKSLKELTIKNNFMFGAAMTSDPYACAGVIERTAGLSVEHVEVCAEKSVLYHPEHRGVRLDVYAKDENHTHYNIEMQVLPKPALEKRARYYHSQIDMELLFSGQDYQELPNTYVIFICDFDPFGQNRYRYIFQHRCDEDRGLRLDDGCTTIFLNTYGTNDTEVPAELSSFLKFVRADLAESMGDFGDPFVKYLQKTVSRIKESREMEERFMLLEELLRDERTEARKEGRAEGRAEGRVEGLAEGEERLSRLVQKLMDEKRYEDIRKAMADRAFRDQLYEELQLD